uniref:Uncharacterized protein n=1 Tax=Octactis speculum TaxID=3111310 RepID=A0A7S2CUI8_9STRA|mmetsp:Transcript_3983/g.4632  ORF Transcript_3983/g.4632 Transcript_3983/m.4632 type:complete len:278 (+) Transcript_3983:111-944(+)|eukprot:CAMPEP_0185769426 /NCGR_PEP_ID=MMETSP1174-20130828/53947_1 /TAXON_ID=35687 /ORGANISM="Dictyocha speculum, Strain CCMP1381" /LENGTH=277 /DNA_ID=CAMNT_0028454493 /DNA_START=89 /DNA_END=922 /DNA_ORIENTATION=+
MKLAIVALSLGSAAAFSMSGPARLFNSRHSATTMSATDGPLTDNIWAMSPTVRVQGDTLKTWDIGEESVKRVQLSIKSEGRPVNTEIQLWHTPSYIPTKMQIYSENGITRPIDTVIETPKHPKTVAVYNRANSEFPFDATVANTKLDAAYASLQSEPGILVQGGSLKSYVFGPEVDSVQVMLRSADLGGRNMKCRIEVTQGPNQIKQTIEMYASSGYKNPFYAVLGTPGSINTVRIINQNDVEFPFEAWILPYATNSDSGSEPIMGGGGLKPMGSGW